jgi:polyribonucleotide nucleotidyltransferase
VKVIGMDDRGKVKLSMKAVDQKTGEDISHKAQQVAHNAGEQPAM